MALLALGLVAVASATAAGDKRTVVTIEPRRGLLDVPLQVEATGLEPRARVDLALTTRDSRRRRWRVVSSRAADEHGSLHVDAATLLPELTPANPSVSLLTASLLPLAGRYVIDVELLVGGRVAARATAQRMLFNRAVRFRRLTWRADRLVARYATADGKGEHPAVLILGGSEGGLARFVMPIATLLAARGYTTLQLAYFGVDGLPETLARVPLEYVQRGLRWLARQPGVDSERIVVLGGSRGAELALLVGSRFRSLVYGVAAYSPSSDVLTTPYDCTSPAWTYRGRPVRSVTCDDTTDFFLGKPGSAPIPVERIRGPILLVAGDKDLLWPAGASTRRIATRLRRHGRHDFASLVYADAGHGVAFPLPHMPLATISSPDHALGGFSAPDARARTRAWFVLLDLLARAQR